MAIPMQQPMERPLSEWQPLESQLAAQQQAQPEAHPAQQPPPEVQPAVQSAVQPAARRPAAAARTAAPFDWESFRHFSPLLEASQEYAGRSGCRFRSSSFDGCLDAESGGGGCPAPAAAALARPSSAGRGARRASGHGAGLDGASAEADAAAAEAPSRGRSASTSAKSGAGACSSPKVRMAPAVREYARRLRAGEPALMEELERAFRLVMSESVRNSMVTTCRALCIFPPPSLPHEVLDDDYTFEDVSAPLLVIAQRLYNDKLRREREAEVSEGRCSRAERRAMTAAFIVDFAHEVGVALPPMPETHQLILRDFALQASEWGAEARARRGQVAGGGIQDGDAPQEKRGSWMKDPSSWGATRFLAATAAALAVHNGCFSRGKT